MSAKLIPFGKYKGQPVEILENDPQYAEWLAQQAWAKERYPQIVNVIINKFGNDEETPEHNAMQAKFMSKGYCALLAERLGAFKFSRAPENRGPESRDPKQWSPVQWNHRMNCYKDEKFEFSSEPREVVKLSDLIHRVRFEVGAIDVSFDTKVIRILHHGSVNVGPTLSPPEQYGFEKHRKWHESWTRKEFSSEISTVGGTYDIELKPVVGDDYPAILRQMRNNRSGVLVYGEYTGRGVDEPTFRQFFESQGYRVVKEREISDRAPERAAAAISDMNETIRKEIENLGPRSVDYSDQLFCPIPSTET